MEWIEVTGRTVEDAKELALDRLGVVEDELEFEVLDEPRSGFLGRLGRSEARIRARVKPLSREKPNDRRRRRSTRGRPAKRDERPAGVGATPSRGQKEPEARADAEHAPAGSAGSASSRGRSRRGRGGRSGGARADRATPERDTMEPVDEFDVDVEEATVEIQVPVEEQAETAAKFTVGLVEAFGVAARVQTEVRK